MKEGEMDSTVEARYLRVKNWRDHQHYKDRRPPWIKLLRELIDGDNGRKFREDLNEAEQWQLVRIWLYASGSERVMYDQDGREVPLVAYDERTLRMGIRSVKKVPVDKFIRLGFLEPVSADEVDASFPASTGASTDASFAPLGSALVNGSPPARGRATEQDRGLEGLEVQPNRPVGDESEESKVHDLVALRAAARLYESIPVEGRDSGTERVILAYAAELDAATIHGVRRQLEKKLAADGLFKTAGAYANGALRKAVEKGANPKSERQEAA